MLIPPAEPGRDYGRNPFGGDDTAPRPSLFDGSYDGSGSPLMRVVAIESADRAWSLELLRRRGVVEHADWIIRWSPGQSSALDAARIADGRNVGTVTVELADGAGREAGEAVYDTPFPLAFRAFHPEPPIIQID